LKRMLAVLILVGLAATLGIAGGEKGTWTGKNSYSGHQAWDRGASKTIL